MVGIRWSCVASALVVLTFLALVLSGGLVPLYSDEISLKMMQATVIANNGNLLTLTPQCNSSLTLPIPVSWYPAAAIYQFIFQDINPLMIRISGVVTALICILGVLLGLKRFVSNRLPYEYVLAGFVASLGMGVIPLTLVLSRSEQWLLLLLSYFVFLPLTYEYRNSGKIYSVFVLMTFLVCTSLFFYAHPKSIFFFPVVMASGWVAFRNNRILQLCTILFSVICVVQTLMMAKEVASCVNAPILASINASQTVNVSKLVTQPALLIKLFFVYFTSFPEKAVQYSTFRSEYFSTWLPALPPGEGLDGLTLFANRLISIFVYILLVAGFVLPIITILIAFFRRVLSYFHLMLVVIWISVITHLVIYVNWNFYASLLVIFVFILLILLCVADIPWSKHWRVLGYSSFLSVCSVFILSAFVHFSTLTPRLIEVAGLTNDFGVPGQPSSVPTFRYPEQRDRIRRLASDCGVNGDGSTHLVIDDLTYFSFDRLREPMHLAYISEKASGQDIKNSDFISFLNKMNSSGIIGKCSLFPDSVRSGSLERSGFCCLSFEKY